MKKQILKKFNINLTLIILGIGLFLFGPAFANANDLIDVVFETEENPLFQEANFLPGQATTPRWVEVTNKSSETQQIGVEIIDKSLCLENCLSDVLDLTINENGTILYSGTLTTFYQAGEKFLSDLGPANKTKYYFAITFNPVAGNIYQDSSTNFDIKIGSFGKESIGEEITPGGSAGGGNVIVSELVISNEQFSEIRENSVTITWNTSYPSTSRVIYSPEGLPRLLQLNNPPNYGYIFSTIEDSDKVTTHSVPITGLTAGTKYYYRAVSHGSLAISQERSFTTLGAREEEVIEEWVAGEEVPVVEISLDELFGKDQEEETVEAGVEEAGIEEEDLFGAPELSEAAVEEGPIFDFGKLLAGIGGLFRPKNLPWLILLFLAIIIILLILRRRKKKE